MIYKNTPHRIRFFIPENLDLHNLFKRYYPLESTKLSKDIDKFYYLIDKLYTSRFYNIPSVKCHSKKYKTRSKVEKNALKNTFYPLYFKLLQKILTTEKAKCYIDILINLNVIETNGFYIPTTHNRHGQSKGYRMNIDYANVPFTTVECVSDLFNKKLLTFYECDFRKLPSHIADIYVASDRFYFDDKEAANIVENTDWVTLYKNTKKQWSQDRLLSMQESIERLKNGDPQCFRSESGRMYYRYNNLKRELRTCIKSKDTNGRLDDVDIANSQPLFLALLLMKENILTPDSQKYIQLCIDGDLYDYLIRKTSCSTKDEVKDNIWVLLFGKSGWTSTFKEEFGNKFPTVISYLNTRNTNGGSELAIQLQTMESDLILIHVCKELLDNNVPMITIHDGIMVARDKSNYAKSVIIKWFNNMYGITPRVRIKSLDMIYNRDKDNNTLYTSLDFDMEKYATTQQIDTESFIKYINSKIENPIQQPHYSIVNNEHPNVNDINYYHKEKKRRNGLIEFLKLLKLRPEIRMISSANKVHLFEYENDLYYFTEIAKSVRKKGTDSTIAVSDLIKYFKMVDKENKVRNNDEC